MVLFTVFCFALELFAVSNLSSVTDIITAVIQAHIFLLSYEQFCI